MLKAANPSSIQRLISLWSVATGILVIYFLMGCSSALSSMRAALNAVSEARKAQVELQQVEIVVQEQRTHVGALLAMGDLSMPPQEPDYDELLEDLLPRLAPGEASELNTEIKQEASRMSELLARAQNGNLQQARSDFSSQVDSTTKLDEHLLSLTSGFDGVVAEQEQNLKSFQILVMLFLLGGLGLGALICWRVSAELNARLQPLNDCSALALRMGEGDFSVALPAIRYRDEVGAVTDVLGGCFRRLRDLSHRGQSLALEIATLSDRVLDTSRHQSAAAALEAQIAQEAADGVDDLTRSAGEMLSLSQEVIQRARVTEASTRSGLQAVQDTVRSVGTTLEQLQAVGDIAVALSENTRIIGDVVTMINDISDRSNIVAINASILAAATGTEGKSFAVVAREMKTLADQSKDASAGVRGILKNIERGIQTCAHLTEEAVNQGKSTGAATDDSDITIRRLAENIKNSLLTFQETVKATQGQHESCGKVAQSLARLQSSCSDSTRGARELEAAAQEMHEVAARLVTLMSIYKQAPARTDCDKSG